MVGCCSPRNHDRLNHASLAADIPTSSTMMNTIPTRIHTPSNTKDVTYNIPVRITTRHNTLQRKFSGQMQHAYKSTPYNCIKVKNVESPANLSSVCPTFFLSNVCHISNKIDELSGIVSINNPSVIMVTETWLSKNIPVAVIKIGNNYEIFRLDRDTLGGGILAYISSYIRVERLTHLEETGKEVLWLVLKPPRTLRPFSTIIVVIVYYPPG